MKKINNYPMSLLSFMILTNNYSVKEKNEAYEELKRRFSVNGCNYDAFMEYEQEAINKRGSNLENYLIKDNPSGQELMQMYFNYVYGKEIFQHGNLLFSENLLCNSDSKNSFFTRALKIELNNIKKRIEANNYTAEDLEKLKLIHQVLDNRCKNKEKSIGGVWYENSLNLCVFDITGGDSTLMNDKRKERVERWLKKYEDEEKKPDVGYILIMLYTMLLDIELLDYFNMSLIANKDLSKLRKQQVSIIKSLKKDDLVDYSFVDTKKLQLVSEKRRNGSVF